MREFKYTSGKEYVEKSVCQQTILYLENCVNTSDFCRTFLK